MHTESVQITRSQSAGKSRAAIYARMSTDPQDHSIQQQCDLLYDYAAVHRMEVVRLYFDEGKSGLRIKGRTGLQKLLADVEGGTVDFNVVLVHDVSRWGRFQDLDESAHYEFLCRRAGIQIIYCAEQFENNGSMVSSILKSLKRAMAAEYSRELSARVSAAQISFAKLGFKPGGRPGYGLRRAQVDKDGKFKRILKPGERKGHPSERVIFAPGSPMEVDTVRHIYRWYLDDRLGDSRIAKMLNLAGIPPERGANWTKRVVRNILTSEKYIGNIVFNRNSYKMRTSAKPNPPELWARSDGAFRALVAPSDFAAAQAERVRRHRRHTDDELIAMLSALYKKLGRITASIISQEPGYPGPQTYKYHFGTLKNAYELAGIPIGDEFRCIETRRGLIELRKALRERVVELSAQAGNQVHMDAQSGAFTFGNQCRVRLLVVRCRHDKCGYIRWAVPIGGPADVDYLIAARTDRSNRKIDSYYLFPTREFAPGNITIRDERLGELARYRYDRLESIFGIKMD